MRLPPPSLPPPSSLLPLLLLDQAGGASPTAGVTQGVDGNEEGSMGRPPILRLQSVPYLSTGERRAGPYITDCKGQWLHSQTHICSLEESQLQSVPYLHTSNRGGRVCVQGAGAYGHRAGTAGYSGAEISIACCIHTRTSCSQPLTARRILSCINPPNCSDRQSLTIPHGTCRTLVGIHHARCTVRGSIPPEKADRA